jgi:hypothetical protein
MFYKDRQATMSITFRNEIEMCAWTELSSSQTRFFEIPVDQTTARPTILTCIAQVNKTWNYKKLNL